MKFNLAKLGIPTEKISIIFNGLNEKILFYQQKGCKIRVGVCR